MLSTKMYEPFKIMLNINNLQIFQELDNFTLPSNITIVDKTQQVKFQFTHKILLPEIIFDILDKQKITLL